jgi:hypothetical protein
MNKVSTADVEMMAIASIVVGERRRTTVGNIRKLAKSIEAHGLIHPLLVRGSELVAGRRRLAACVSLGWTKVPVRHVERLTDDELRALELDENIHREALNDFETTKARLAEIRQAEADAKREAANNPAEISGATSARNSRGRPKGRKAGSRRDIAETTGVDRRTQERVEKHVALAEAYPFLQRAGWTTPSVLEAGQLIERIPDADRVPIFALLDQDAIPAKRAIQALASVVDNADRRREVIRLAQSPDEFERRSALAMIAEVPPPPDPGLVIFVSMEREARRCAKVARSAYLRNQAADVGTTLHTVIEIFRREQKGAANGDDNAAQKETDNRSTVVAQ